MGWIADQAGAARAVAANRPVRRAVGAYGLFIAAESASAVGLAVVAFRAGGVGAVGLLEVLRSVPSAVLGPLLAAATARMVPQRVLQAVLAVRVLMFVGLVAVVTLHGPFAAVVALAVLDGIIYARYWPTQAALLTTLADTAEELTAANLGSTAVENLGVLVGPGLAAPAIATAGPNLVFLVCAVLASVSLLAVTGSRGAGATAPRVEGRSRVGVLAAARTLVHEPAVRLVAWLYLAQVAAQGALGVLLVGIAVDLAGMGDSGVGLLAIAQGVGGVSGSLVALALVGRRRLSGPLVMALIVLGAALAVVAAMPTTAVAMIALTVAGAAVALGDVATVTVFQRVVRTRMLDPVLTMVEGLWSGAFGLGAAAAGVLGESIGVRATLAVAALWLVLACGLASRGLWAVDAQSQVPERPLAVLRRVPWFSGQPPLSVERLAFDLMPVEAAAGEVVIRRGDAGDRFYLIESGTVEIDGRLTLGPGGWFGEVALLYDIPRTATVRARTACHLFALSREDFLQAISSRGTRTDAEAALVQLPSDHPR